MQVASAVPASRQALDETSEWSKYRRDNLLLNLMKTYHRGFSFRIERERAP